MLKRTFVALALASALIISGTALAATGGGYKGTINEKTPIHYQGKIAFSYTHGKLKSVHFTVAMMCDDFHARAITAHLTSPVTVLKNGSFNYKTQNVQFKGKLKGRKGSGTLFAHAPVGLTSCSTFEDVPWTAKH